MTTSLDSHLKRPKAAFLLAALTLVWVFNPSFGPSPIVPQACIAAAAAVLWFLGAPSSRDESAAVVATAWLAGAGLNAAIGLAQYFGAIEDSSLWLSAAAPGEVFGNLRQRNQLATLLALGLASAFYLASRVQGRGRWGLALCVVLLSAANALTSSRTGILHWAVLCGAVALLPLWGAPTWWRRWSLLAAVSFVAVLATVLLTAPVVFDRLSASESCVSRKVLWANALYLAAQHPWTGWGLGEMDYAHYATLYPGERFCLIVDNAHNLFLQAAVELGWPVAVLLLAALGAALLVGRPWRERQAHRLLAWAVIGLILLHSMVEFPLWYGPFQLAALLAMALLWRAPSTEGALALTPRRVWQSARLLCCALATAALIYVVWDYYRISQLYLSEADRLALYRDSALGDPRRSALFRAQVEFAQFTTTDLTADNAPTMAQLGERVLHYSPEPQVIEVLIQALRLSGREERAAWHLARFQAAFPREYEAWSRR